MRLPSLLLHAAAATITFAQANEPVYLDIEFSDSRGYRYDTADVTKFATETSRTQAAPAANLWNTVGMQDIRYINGRPAKGIIVLRTTRLALSPAPAPGGAIADVARGAAVDISLEIVGDDGSPIGGLTAQGLFGGTAPDSPLRPAGGAPGGFPSPDWVGNMAVTGGTGVFIGARGVWVTGPNPVVLPLITPVPDASVTESPTHRRERNGITTRHMAVIFPMIRPAVIVSNGQPAILHADFSPATSARPARRGETLIIRASGLGPGRGSRAGVFPANPVQVVNWPIQVEIAGRVVEAINRIGWPGETDVYRIDFQVPSETPVGTVRLRIISAWMIPSNEVSLQVE